MTTVFLFLRRTVALGFRPPWMTEPEELDVKDCKHSMAKRYGNRHGRFAKCLQCGARFKWNQTADTWDYMGSLPSSPLPLPCSENIRAPLQAQPSQAATSSNNSSRLGAYAKTKAKAQASTTTSSTFTGEQRRQLMANMLRRAREELIAENATERDIQMIEQDMTENFEDYYLQEHQQDIDRVLQLGQNAHQMLNSTLDEAQLVPASDEEEEDFRWVH